MSFFDQFKRKYDRNKDPLTEAVAFLQPQLAAWQLYDECRLSLARYQESNLGWGSVTDLGLLYAQDERPLVSYVKSNSAGIGYEEFRLAVTTSREQFFFERIQTDATKVFYSGQPIGWISRDIQAFTMQGQSVFMAGPVPDELDARAPMRFACAHGVQGWFNLPPRSANPTDYRLHLLHSRAIAPFAGYMPKPYELMWMMAMYFYVAFGPDSMLFPNQKPHSFGDDLKEGAAEFFGDVVGGIWDVFD